MKDINLEAIVNTEIGGLSIGKILAAIVTLVVCILAIKIILKLAKRITSKSRLNERVSSIILKVLKIILYLVTIVIVCSALGINTSSLVAVVSVASLGITLATEDILGNVAGGIVLYTSKPFEAGDYIAVDGIEGHVTGIYINHTRIKTINGQIVVVPNKLLSTSKITNYATLGYRRIDSKFGVSYDAPTETVMNALKAAVGRMDKVITDGKDVAAPLYYLSEFGESAIEYTVYCWVKYPDYLETKMRLNEAVREEFARNNIDITYNHLNVHMV